MEHAIDLAINVLKKIEDTESALPMFHRNGYLFVLGKKGFAQIRTDLLPHWEPIRYPEREESDDAIALVTEEDRAQRARYTESEAQHFELIDLHSCSTAFTLKEMRDLERILSSVDDGRIRMVETSSSHRSHMGGYGLDGIDVHVRSAQVMDRVRYLEIAREKEDFVMEQMQRVADELESKILPQGRVDSHLRDAYSTIRLPDAVIITEYLYVAFPRDGSLEPECSQVDMWDNDSPLGIASTTGSVLKYELLSGWSKKPFGIKIAVNNQQCRSDDADALHKDTARVLDGVGKYISAVTTGVDTNCADEIGDYVRQLNRVHEAVRRHAAGR
jgi:hypothetical protein